MIVLTAYNYMDVVIPEVELRRRLAGPCCKAMLTKQDHMQISLHSKKSCSALGNSVERQPPSSKVGQYFQAHSRRGEA